MSRESTHGEMPVSIKFLPSQRRAVTEVARRAGVSRSAWIKAAIAEKMQREETASQ